MAASIRWKPCLQHPAGHKTFAFHVALLSRSQMSQVGGLRRVPEPGSGASLPSGFLLTSAGHGLGADTCGCSARDFSCTLATPVRCAYIICRALLTGRFEKI